MIDGIRIPLETDMLASERLKRLTAYDMIERNCPGRRAMSKGSYATSDRHQRKQRWATAPSR